MPTVNVKVPTARGHLDAKGDAFIGRQTRWRIQVACSHTGKAAIVLYNRRKAMYVSTTKTTLDML
jgi:hypothetical protein